MKTKVDNKTKKKSKKKKGMDSHTKILIGFFSFIGIILLIAAGLYVYFDYKNTPSYKNVEFTRIKDGNLEFYGTKIITTKGNKENKHNVYIRNHPSELKKVKFDDEGFKLMQIGALRPDFTDNCNGYTTISYENLKMTHREMGVNFVVDYNATCDEQGRYSLITVKAGDTTKIEKVAKNCYEITIKDCEILKGTERYLVEALNAYNNLE